MKNWTKLATLWFLLLIIYLPKAYSFTDPYPKNPQIDALNYRFEFELSDDTDEIQGKATVDVRFLSEGTKTLRLDLINKSSALENKGMTVRAVTSKGEPVIYEHEKDVLLISLPKPSLKNQRSQFEDEEG